MQLRVVNCPDRNFKPYVEQAASFFSKELISNTRIRNNCYTTIRFSAKLEEYGFASVEEFNTKNEPREFLIEIHPGIGVRNIMSTLAHEMVHVKQYINGELDDAMTTWKGKKVNSDKIDYWIQPWEVEAHGIEPGLLYKFVVLNQLWEVFEEFKNPATPIVSRPIKWKKM